MPNIRDNLDELRHIEGFPLGEDEDLHGLSDPPHYTDMLGQTAAGIPVRLRAFFQEYRLEDLDPERSAFTVIERTLAWGDVPELRWLFARYGPEQLAQWVRQAGWYCLPRRRLKYWLCFFEIADYRHGDRVWPH